ncbi:ComE operon protein 3 [subsurface metagenome]
MLNNLFLKCKTSIRRVPALSYLFCISIGIISAKFISIREFFLVYILLFLLITLFLLYIVWRRIRPVVIDLLLLFSLFVASMFTFAIRDHFPFREEIKCNANEHFGMLLQNPIREGKKIVFNVRLINNEIGSFLPFGVKVYVEELENDIGYGDVVRFEGWVKEPPSVRNPGGFNYRDFLKRKGIYYITYIKEGDINCIGHIRVNPFLRKIIFPIKEYCEIAISKNLDNIHGSLLQGLTLGQRGDIPKEIKNIFSDAGVIHILAVSGLHVGIISFFLFILFRSLHIPFNLSIILTCFLLIIYAFLTDLRPPVVRATIMFMFIMLGLLSQKRIVLLNVIAASAILILILKPLDLFDTGFQLSYAATFSIVILHQKIYDCFPKRLKKIKMLRNFVILPFSVSLSAQLGTAPIVAFYFFKIPIIAVITNIIIVPLVSLVIPTGFLTVAGNILHPVISRILAGANWFLLHLIIKASMFFSNLPHLLLWVRRPTVLFFVLYYPALFTFFVLKPWKRVKFLIFASLVILNIIVFTKVWRIYHPVLTVDFLDVSQGDASVIEFPNNEVCIVDGGRRSDYVDYGERVITPFLRSKGIKNVSAVIVTHPDVDHYGGLITVVENFNVKKLLLNGSPKVTFLYRKLLDTAKNSGVPVYNIHRGEVIWIGDYPLYVLNPPILKGMEFLPSNEGSIVFKFGYGDITFLFTGDFSNRIVKLPSLFMHSTILKFPHHGARFSDERGFLSAVNPEITTISVGKDNRYGHPSKEGIAILDSLKSQIYRTDEDGAIILRTDGKTVRIAKTIK